MAGERLCLRTCFPQSESDEIGIMQRLKSKNRFEWTVTFGLVADLMMLFGVAVSL